jgi:hypothetical protein
MATEERFFITLPVCPIVAFTVSFRGRRLSN